MSRARGARRSPDEMIDRGETRELGIFVPAIMSAGIIFSLVALLQDALQRRRWSTRRRHGALASGTTVQALRDGRVDVRAWLRPRAAYAAIAVVGIVGGGLLGDGATENYFRTGGYVEGVAWLWALSLLVAGALVAVGVTAAAVALRWDRPPVWTLGLLGRTPLSRRPTGLVRNVSASQSVTAAAWTAGMLGLLAIVVAALPGVVSGSDRRFADIVASWSMPEWFAGAARLGGPEVVLLVSVLAVVAGFRCLTFAVTYVGAVAATYVGGFLLVALVQRSEPLGVRLTGETTFPWVPVAQVTVVAGLLPFVLGVWRAPRWSRVAATVALAAAVGATALEAVHDRDAWPTDVIGGLLLGLTVVLVGRWVLAGPERHRACPGCPWAGSVDRRATAVIHLSDEWVRGLQRGAIAWTLVLAGVFGALAVLVGIPQDPDGSMLPAVVSSALQVALVVLMAVGALVAFRRMAIGATFLALAGIGLGVLSAAEYPPTVAILVTFVVLGPAFALWLAWQRDASGRRIWAVALTATVLLAAAFAGAAAVYDELFGPTHPSSPLALRPVDRVEWAWSGGVTTDGAVVVARTDFGADRARVVLRPARGGPPVRSRTVAVPDSRIVRMRASGLESGTEYRWRVVVDGAEDHERGRGSLATPPRGPSSFTAVVGGCARTGSNGQVFDAMRAEDPDLVVFTGDIHYENIAVDDVDAFRAAYDRTLTQPAVAALLRQAPVAYLWDDHDYGPNDADRSSPSRPAARAAYRESVPFDTLAPVGPAAHAFSVGRVRFVVTDERSQRTDHSMLGERQMRWFLDELRRASRTHALVVWVNSVPWIGEARPGADGWAGYPDDRRRVAEVIAGAGIDNLVMLAGDAHMVAVDDGTDSGYAADGGGGFPLLHAAALDRPGSVKGGPYSGGAVGGGGQYGVMRVVDDGRRVTVSLEGKRWDGETLVSYRFTTPESP